MTRKERLINVASAGVWLVFLLSPVVAAFSRDVSGAARAVMLMGLALFLVSYLLAFAEVPLVRTSRTVNLVVTTLVMLVGIAMMAPASGVAVVYATTYFIALWMFLDGGVRARWIAFAAFASGVVAAILFSPPTLNVLWLIGPLLMAFIFVMSMALLVQYEESVGIIRQEARMAAEREAIARDVHDLLGHSLTVVAVKTDLARRLLSADPERARAELDDVLQTTREALTEVRGTVGRLRTPDLREQLAASVSALRAAEISARIPAPDAARTVPATQHETFAWCLRELVTNIIRHAQAATCTVDLEPGRLVVADDGVGCADAGEGNGLRGLRERVGAQGGSLQVDSDGSGTRVEVRL